MDLVFGFHHCAGSYHFTLCSFQVLGGHNDRNFDNGPGGIVIKFSAWLCRMSFIRAWGLFCYIGLRNSDYDDEDTYEPIFNRPNYRPPRCDIIRGGHRNPRLETLRVLLCHYDLCIYYGFMGLDPKMAEYYGGRYRDRRGQIQGDAGRNEQCIFFYAGGGSIMRPHSLGYWELSFRMDASSHTGESSQKLLYEYKRCNAQVFSSYHFKFLLWGCRRTSCIIHLRGFSRISLLDKIGRHRYDLYPWRNQFFFGADRWLHGFDFARDLHNFSNALLAFGSGHYHLRGCFANAPGNHGHTGYVEWKKKT